MHISVSLERVWLNRCVNNSDRYPRAGHRRGHRGRLLAELPLGFFEPASRVWRRLLHNVDVRFSIVGGPPGLRQEAWARAPCEGAQK